MTFFSHMLNDEVDIESISSTSTSGAPTYSTRASNVSARVDRSVENAFNEDGTESDVKTKVILDQSVTEDERIILPSGEKMEVKTVEKHSHVHGSDTMYIARG